MKWLIVIMICLTTGCSQKCIDLIKCPAPPALASISYQVDTLPASATTPDIIKAITQDLVTCRDRNDELMVIFSGYKTVP